MCPPPATPLCTAWPARPPLPGAPPSPNSDQSLLLWKTPDRYAPWGPFPTPAGPPARPLPPSPWGRSQARICLRCQSRGRSDGASASFRWDPTAEAAAGPRAWVGVGDVWLGSLLLTKTPKLTASFSLSTALCPLGLWTPDGHSACWGFNKLGVRVSVSASAFPFPTPAPKLYTPSTTITTPKPMLGLQRRDSQGSLSEPWAILEGLCVSRSRDARPPKACLPRPKPHLHPSQLEAVWALPASGCLPLASVSQSVMWVMC